MPEDILETIHRQGIRHLKAQQEEGPICIIDAKGVYPERLDKAVEQQAEYYRKIK